MSDIWKDPKVKAALKSGRSANDIMVLPCPHCGEWGYYNQGSHFSHCNRTWSVITEDEEPPDDRPWMTCMDATALADTVTVCEDTYDNRTLPPDAA